MIIDSDGHHDPDDIPRLLAELRKGNDVIIGSRFNGSNGEGIPFYRKIGMKILDTATMVAGTNLEITDSQSGFRAYGKRAIEAIKIDNNGMGAGSEILIQISDHHLKVAEVPIKVRYDIEGASSKNPLSHGIGVLMSITKHISLRRPLSFFGIPGVLLSLLGFGVEIYTFSRYYQTGQFPYIIFTGGFSMIILGMLLVTSGLILHSLVQIMQDMRQQLTTNIIEPLDDHGSENAEGGNSIDQGDFRDDGIHI